MLHLLPETKNSDTNFLFGSSFWPVTCVFPRGCVTTRPRPLTQVSCYASADCCFQPAACSRCCSVSGELQEAAFITLFTQVSSPCFSSPLSPLLFSVSVLLLIFYCSQLHDMVISFKVSIVCLLHNQQGSLDFSAGTDAIAFEYE